MPKKTDVLEKDLYALLEVDPNARSEVIKAAYYALNDLAEATGEETDVPLDEIKEAFKVLGNASRKELYDKSRIEDSGRVIGNYRVTEVISKEGAIGATYKAIHNLINKPVCIKHCHKISAQSAQILMEEANAFWDLRHYSIPAARGLLRLEDGNLALIMSYIPGLNLFQLIEKVKRLEPEYVAWIAERLLNMLSYLKDNEVIHGDIKPQNIIIQEDLHTVVAVDFGLAEVKPRKGSLSKGHTDYFSPPEQIDQSGPLLPESDLYSLGMTMIYALSGSLEAVEKRIVPENVPEPMCEFIERLICQDVLDRPRWEDEDLFQTFKSVRMESFGREHSGMKPAFRVKPKK